MGRGERLKFSGFVLISCRPDCRRPVSGIQEMQHTRIARFGVVAAIQRGARFLTIRRSQHVSAPGTVCFPGGGIEQGETSPEALCRELQEELDIRNAMPIREVWRSVTARRVHLTWWLTEIADDVILCPNPAEVAEIHWWTAAEMLSLPRPAGQQSTVLVSTRPRRDQHPVIVRSHDRRCCRRCWKTTDDRRSGKRTAFRGGNGHSRSPPLSTRSAVPARRTPCAPKS